MNMDKQFWLDIRENKYAFPTDHDLIALTDELFTYLSSVDPELRDGIGYEVFANWIETEPYSANALRDYLARLLENLNVGLGERDTDTVFRRAFSILFLAEVIHRDNQKPFLESAEVNDALARVLTYLAAERDPRGYVPVKGWAHALAHTADALMAFALSPHVDSAGLMRILNAITEKMRASIDWIYVHGEDGRLARTVVTTLARDALSTEEVQAWSESLTSDWKGAWQDEARTRAYFNTRNLLRAIHLSVLSATELPRKDELSAIFLDAVIAMRPF
ncbi:MAG: hypothetical protein HFACDABA_01774 [Anaerolineales bacterium]|nr:hypothetical protein [Anaerolineales bacterium]